MSTVSVWLQATYIIVARVLLIMSQAIGQHGVITVPTRRAQNSSRKAGRQSYSVHNRNLREALAGNKWEGAAPWNDEITDAWITTMFEVGEYERGVRVWWEALGVWSFRFTPRTRETKHIAAVNPVKQPNLSHQTMTCSRLRGSRSFLWQPCDNWDGRVWASRSCLLTIGDGDDSYVATERMWCATSFRKCRDHLAKMF